MLARYGPITLRSYVGSDTACALLYTKLQREDAAMMETALDRPAVDSTLPPEVLDGVGATLRPEKRLMLAVLEGAVSDF